MYYYIFLKQRNRLQHSEAHLGVLIKWHYNLFTNAGNDISCKLDIEVQSDAPAPAVRYLRAGRELKNDSRTKIITSGNKSSLQIRRSRFTDEAKYTAILEQEGVPVDEATWSVFVKGKVWSTCWWGDIEYEK